MTSRKYLIIQILAIFGVVIFSLVDFYLYKNGYFEEERVTLKYQENNDIDYKVYLKKNDFFETEYLEKGGTYITSLIDHINVDFDYNIAFDHVVSGNYLYYVSVTVDSKKNNNDAKYWSKDYRLTDEVKKDLKMATEFSIKENIDIDYKKYNELLAAFKKEMALNSSEGVLNIYLNVDSEIEGNKIKTPIKSKLLLKMPLTELTVEATAVTDAPDNVKEVNKIVNSDKVKSMRTLGIVYIVGVIACIILFFIMNKKRKDVNKYDNMIKKILNTYDSIIVNIKKIPNIDGYKEIYVDTFEELLDAHSEVRMPINYYKDVGKSYFILLNDTTAWIYVASKRKIERK